MTRTRLCYKDNLPQEVSCQWVNFFCISYIIWKVFSAITIKELENFLVPVCLYGHLNIRIKSIISLSSEPARVFL